MKTLTKSARGSHFARRVMLAWVMALGALASSSAFPAAGWTTTAQITELNQQPGTGAGSMLVFIETTLSSNPSGCSHQQGFYLAVNDERQQRIFAMLLAAQMAGRNVRMYTTGNCHSWWGYAELDGLVVN